MKTTILALLALSSISVPWSCALAGPLDAPVGRVTIHGRVIQRTPQGLLIQTARKGDQGQVWLHGSDAKEGQTITLPCMKVEPFGFLAAGGFIRMLDAYEVMK